MRGGSMFKTNSIVFKFLVPLTIILFILFSVLLLSNIYSLEVVRNHFLNNARNTLEIYVENIHNNLSIYSKDLTEVFENNIDIAIDRSNNGDDSSYFQDIQLMNALKAKVSNNYSSDGVFIKLPGSAATLIQFGNRSEIADKLILADFLDRHEFRPDSQTEIDQWTSLIIQDQHYLFKFITYNDITFGTFVKASSLLSIAQREGDGFGHYVLSNHEGIILASTDSGFVGGEAALRGLRDRHEDSYLFISEPINEFGQIIHIAAKQNIFSGLKLIQWLIISLGFISIIVIPLLLRWLAKDILQPILELVRAAKEVETGQPEFPLPSERYSLEFMKLFHSFHSMVNEITTLKIRTYEEQIEKSRNELKYLQMQIRPHFFLNAISTISSLSYQQKNEEIREWISLLSKHLRYMFKGAFTFVPINEEMSHVENYIRMQEIRYPDQIFYMTDIDYRAGEIEIPQFLIQTFVENIFKHAMTYGEMLSIFIRADIEMLNEEPFVRIVVEDNGEGFPEALQIHEPVQQEARETDGQVGIANIRRTLQLIYKRDDLLYLSNVERSGARVELRIPVYARAD